MISPVVALNGEKETPLHPNVKLYLPNPHYLPEIQAETALSNSTVTQSGLEDCPDFSIWAINWMGFKLTCIGVSECQRILDNKYTAGGNRHSCYRLRRGMLSREGGSSRTLGRCFSSCVIDSFLYILYDASLVKCDQNTGYMIRPHTNGLSVSSGDSSTRLSKDLRQNFSEKFAHPR